MALQASYPLGQRRDNWPGTPVDTSRKDGRTMTAGGEITFGGAIQRSTGGTCLALFPGQGKFAGIALRSGSASGEGGLYEAYDNVLVSDAGHYWHIADTAFAEGAGLNWNSATGRWTIAPPGGSIIATPGVEATTASSGNGAPITILIRRAVR